MFTNGLPTPMVNLSSPLTPKQFKLYDVGTRTLIQFCYTKANLGRLTSPPTV